MRKLRFVVIDCINQSLKTRFPDGVDLKYTAKTGKKYIDKEEFEFNKLFEWGESKCPITSMTYEQSEKS